ncbi:MAG TPA: hypothetical protein VN213_09905 [Solirubrobacteraceae bacterium]|nr:hypothetical protein [Solirubrobacteraceae bacterium]
MVRRVVMAVALTFVAVLAALTLYVLVSRGPDALVVLSALVVAVLAYGVIGALHAGEDG